MARYDREHYDEPIARYDYDHTMSEKINESQGERKTLGRAIAMSVKDKSDWVA